MTHSITKDDERFREDVESLTFPVSEFDHRAHLRLAYIYLVERSDIDSAVKSMRETLTGLLKHAGLDPSEKYHETLTEAWVLAVNHFMNNTEDSNSADNFIDQSPEIMDSKIMLTHYSAEVLFSDEARQTFIEPNLDSIPRHAK